MQVYIDFWKVLFFSNLHKEMMAHFYHFKNTLEVSLY